MPTATPGCCVDRLWADRNPDHPDADAVRRKSCGPHNCMKLPAGKTCGGCSNFAGCKALFGCKPDNTQCDYFPRRFTRTT